MNFGVRFGLRSVRQLSLFCSAGIGLLSVANSLPAEVSLALHCDLGNGETIDVRRGNLRWQRLASAGQPSETRTATLHATNTAWLRHWLETRHIFSLPADFPATNALTEIHFGSLAVDADARQRLIIWETGCDCAELMSAVSELKSFAADVAAQHTSKNLAAEFSSPLPEFLPPVKKMPFKQVVQTTTRHRVLDFDPGNPEHVRVREAIRAAAMAAGRLALTEGVFAARANEAGNHMEPFVKRALRELKLDARTPVNTSGDAQITGYPDLEISGPAPCYLELKTYNAATENTTQRTFYYSPSSHPKITRDALHLLLAYEMKKIERAGKTAFAPVHWKLITLENLSVDLKFEFNQSNRGLYGAGTARAVMAEGTINE